MIKNWHHRLARPVLMAVPAIALGAALLAPAPAYAWWHHHDGWGGPRFGVSIGIPLVAPPPVYYARPPAYAYYGPPPAYYGPPRIWIRPHRDWAGAWVPGHWRYRR